MKVVLVFSHFIEQLHSSSKQRTNPLNNKELDGCAIRHQKYSSCHSSCLMPLPGSILGTHPSPTALRSNVIEDGKERRHYLAQSFPFSFHFLFTLTYYLKPAKKQKKKERKREREIVYICMDSNCLC